MWPEQFNIAAVLVAAVAYFILGGIWYAVFNRPWMRYAETTAEKIKQGSYAGAYVTAAMTSLLCAATLAYFIGLIQPESLAGCMTIGLAASVGFVVSAAAKHYAFLDRHPGLLAIDGAYDVVSFCVMAAILWAWQ